MLSAIPINGETWLICGSRDFDDKIMFNNAMGQLIFLRGCPAKVVHGGATGADAMAGDWANRMAIEVVAHPADWNAHSRAAGPIRNQQMLDQHHPALVVAFPGGRGTADMVKRAKAADIRIAEITAEQKETA